MEYSVLPLRNTVLFPNQIIPIYIGRKASLDLIKDIDNSKNKDIVVVAQKDGNIESPLNNDLYQTGTLATVMKIFDMPDNSKSAIVKGIRRVKLGTVTSDTPYFKATIDELSETLYPFEELNKLCSTLKKLFSNLIDIAPYLSEEQTNILINIKDPSQISDKAISVINIPTKEKQEILEKLDVKDKIKLTIKIINREIQRLELGDKIQADVQGEISKSQKEYYLREQLRAIKKELGDEDSSLELDELKEKIDKIKMSDEATKVANKELNRLQKIPTHSPEYTVTRTYLDWLIELPWEKESNDNEDIKHASKVLDEGHYGLDKVKERIIEHLAVRNLKRSRSKKGEIIKSPILCFAGPPGTGKTSIGKDIANSMGREFVRISLGGVRDEAEIRGHRRTYIGALPGRIITSLKKAGTKNPIFILDEIDKLGTDFRGDPSSALLEVLDPEQNFSFNDHYLEVDFDLSNIMFITTANRIDQIPGPLLDRMEVLDFSGYIHDEKIQIAKKHLLPKMIKEHGLKKKEISFNQEALSVLIESYTREAGVRNLERQIANVCRKVAKNISIGTFKSIKIDGAKVSNLLGPEIFFSDVAERCTKPGVVIGLAWTAFGGDILFIEASKMLGKGNLKLTGKLGDVMKESAQAAYSYVRTNAKMFNIDEDFYKKYDIHIHVPAGAIPKDGPSAGVAMITSIVSLLTDKPIKNKLGMTGEISLRGNVLPIGGLKEKSTAAHRSGLNHIIVPFQNKKDLEDIPEKVKKDLKISFVKEVEDVIKLALDL
ncbi:MAG: endopeptidase La [Candidatus Marinimicrobia bacterium]|nr:endopeptidase La [Candidatus Neomarinimicrobiota bacterium]|tara:strand:+ start:2641 stop:4959 length:2319 start_codon:yes stop_codon:yes gene_type:complete